MSSPDKGRSIYDLGKVISSSPGLDVLELDVIGESSVAIEPVLSVDVYGLPVEDSIGQREVSAKKEAKKQQIWIHTFPHWERKAPTAQILVVDFSQSNLNAQEEVREELQVA